MQSSCFTHYDNVRNTRTLAPSAATVYARVIDEIREHKLAGLVRRGACKDSDHKRGRPDSMPVDTDRVQMLENDRVQSVEQPLGTEHGGVDTDGCLRCRLEVRAQRRDSGEEVRAREATGPRSMWLELRYLCTENTPDAGCDCDLPEKVEPAGNP